jgi:integrase/recombinase XerC
MTPNLIYQQVSHYLSLLERETGHALPAKESHLLRHSSASAQLAKGVPVTQVQTNLGHDGLATLQIYAHLLPVWKESAAT